MDCICKFDKFRDVAEASQSGFVDLSDLLKNHILPGNLDVNSGSFNDIDDPQAVFGRPSDNLEAMTIGKTLEARARAAEAAKEAAQHKS